MRCARQAHAFRRRDALAPSRSGWPQPEPFSTHAPLTYMRMLMPPPPAATRTDSCKLAVLQLRGNPVTSVPDYPNQASERLVPAEHVFYTHNAVPWFGTRAGSVAAGA